MVAIFKTLALLATSVVGSQAVIIPKTVTAIRAVNSTNTTLSINLDVIVQLNPLNDTANASIPFTFGSVDGNFTFGNGMLNVVPNGVNSTIKALANATWSPIGADAVKSANGLLSDFCSNKTSKIAVNVNGTSIPVDVNGIGISIVEQLIVYITTRTPITKQSQAQIKILNPFLLPLTFTGLNATAVAPGIVVAGNATDLTLGTITQPDLGNNTFTIPPLSEFTTSKLDAVTIVTVPQTVAVLGAFQAANNSLTVNAVASSSIKIGDFPASITFAAPVPASIGK
ncbi:hypothetical protein HDU97_007567 [Phlyctochytrium planicorne]|nr:hypothetical protein HDU97_007567 [Phlyctochytrium planicorne]